MKNSKYDSIVIHYDEIGLKGKNRGSFERLLIDNIRSKVKKLASSIKNEVGQITLELAEKADLSKIEEALTKIPGIAYFSFAKKCSHDFEKLKKVSIDFIKDIDFETFKVDSDRHYKKYEMKSIDVNAKLGEAILDVYDKKVKMKDPDLTLKVDISNKASYISHESVDGIGGLPTNQNQKVVALLSGGFDSPVAAYMMMKRGCHVILVHFQNKNQMTTAVEGKITDLAEQLSKFQIKTQLYIVPFDKLQKELIMKTKAEVRMVIYRRFMLRIASKIANQNEARFLVLGDSVSQVASQTLENLEATYSASKKQIFTPLIGLNKREIIDTSRKIGTYDISKLPYGDCCSYFLPKHPILKANSAMLTEMESEIDIDKLVDEAAKNAKLIKYN